jgi:hypothetical protein
MPPPCNTTNGPISVHIRHTRGYVLCGLSDQGILPEALSDPTQVLAIPVLLVLVLLMVLCLRVPNGNTEEPAQMSLRSVSVLILDQDSAFPGHSRLDWGDSTIRIDDRRSTGVGLFCRFPPTRRRGPTTYYIASRAVEGGCCCRRTAPALPLARALAAAAARKAAERGHREKEREHTVPFQGSSGAPTIASQSCHIPPASKT